MVINDASEPETGSSGEYKIGTGKESCCEYGLCLKVYPEGQGEPDREIHDRGYGGVHEDTVESFHRKCNVSDTSTFEGVLAMKRLTMQKRTSYRKVNQ